MLNFRNILPRGFSLVEMIVVIAITIVITGVVLANLPSLQSGASIDLVAQEVAVNIRSIQTYSSGTKSANSAILGVATSYGVRFDLASSRPNNVFYSWADLDENGKYTGPTEDQEKFILPGDFYFYQSMVCSSINNCTALNNLAVFYKRPNPEASFLSVGPMPDDTEFIKIIIASKRVTQRRAVEVYANGQIAVRKQSI